MLIQTKACYETVRSTGIVLQMYQVKVKRCLGVELIPETST